MSEAVMRGLVVRLATDSDFADLLRRDADAALAGYDLSVEERLLMTGICDEPRRSPQRRPRRRPSGGVSD